MDLSASYTFNGISGPQKTAPGTPLGPTADTSNPVTVLDTTGTPVMVAPVVTPVAPLIPVETDGASSHNGFFRASGTHGWGVGARFEIPIGNRVARHRLTQREIQLRRARTELRRQEQDVILEVRNTVRNLNSAIKALEAAERRRVAQQETLHAEQERLRLGDSTPFKVLEFEEDLAEAERQQIFSLQVYRNAISGIERARGTLLQTLGVSVQEELQRW